MKPEQCLKTTRLATPARLSEKSAATDLIYAQHILWHHSWTLEYIAELCAFVTSAHAHLSANALRQADV